MEIVLGQIVGLLFLTYSVLLSNTALSVCVATPRSAIFFSQLHTKLPREEMVSKKGSECIQGYLQFVVTVGCNGCSIWQHSHTSACGTVTEKAG